MYRLLVVDDEAIIADGLYEVLLGVPNLELDVYKAYSGQEAMKLFDKTRFDIVLTDIRMPEMDGLQLLENIRAKWPRCRVIFLTGYHEFSYVYTAIQHECVNYLLKTEGYDKVIQTVAQAVSDMEAEWRAEALLEQAREQSEKAKELLRKDFLYGVLRERIEAGEISGEQFAELGVPLRAEEPVLLLLGRVSGLTDCGTYSSKMKQLYRVRTVARTYIESRAAFVDMVHEQYDLVWLLQPLQGSDDAAEAAQEAWAGLSTFLKGSLELVQAACKESSGAELSLVLDDSPVAWGDAAERFAQLHMLMNYRIGRSHGLLLDKQAARSDRDMDNQKANKLRVRPAVLDLLTEQLEHGRKDDFARTLDESTAALREVDTMHHAGAQELYYSIALLFLSYMNRWQLTEQAAAAIGLHKLMRPAEHESWTNAIGYLGKVGVVLFQLQNQEEERRANAVVATIQKHIQAHLHDPNEISLVRLAELAFFNPSYLSRLFKQVTGINLSEYIAEVRMTRAKRLLEDPNLKIQEVAERLGYGTATNFTRSFRKAMNMTPQDYRASIVNK
ncbi:helix-turn-helix domain-containing protein [Paenibacillus antri]|uniref:Helix-turn-helix domain-containing protein n=1 Tax=Paenibacillus antri TaxID=2582848 RepID=A0A5R9G0K4_9BACL|nr:helix-turn-helix domain-containing protein [Paenibacillus antri]TLS49301.1 helix-turn-helix domain-containing protein [Paenibacillus antri]